MRFALFVLVSTLTIAAGFTTYIGDSYPYTVSKITTDSAGNTYVVGSRSPHGPNGSTDVFLIKLDPTGKTLFKKIFGGTSSSSAGGVTLDPSGNIYIAGYTSSTDFPLA